MYKSVAQIFEKEKLPLEQVFSVCFGSTCCSPCCCFFFFNPCHILLNTKHHYGKPQSNDCALF